MFSFVYICCLLLHTLSYIGSFCLHTEVHCHISIASYSAFSVLCPLSVSGYVVLYLGRMDGSNKLKLERAIGY